jgi:hypothetical protein
MKYTLNKPYPETTLVATGGKPFYKWSVIGGAIPDGLQLSDKGVLSGTPSKVGQGDRFIAEVTDIAGAKALKVFILPLEGSSQPNAPKKDSDQASKQAAGNAEKGAPKAPAPMAGTTAKPTPEAPAQVGGGNITPQTNEKAPPKLEDIFSFERNLIGIFVALVFGLTPGLLFDRLQQQADRYKADLKSSQSTGGTQKS